jgi:hypothetical protein
MTWDGERKVVGTCADGLQNRSKASKHEGYAYLSFPPRLRPCVFSFHYFLNLPRQLTCPAPLTRLSLGKETNETASCPWKPHTN